MLYAHPTRHKSWVVYATSFFSPILFWKTIKINDFIGCIEKDEKKKNLIEVVTVVFDCEEKEKERRNFMLLGRIWAIEKN